MPWGDAVSKCLYDTLLLFFLILSQQEKHPHKWLELLLIEADITELDTKLPSKDLCMFILLQVSICEKRLLKSHFVVS